MSVMKRLAYNRTQSVTRSTSASVSSAGALASIDIEGVEQLLKVLDEVAAEQGAKSVNGAMRKATRKVCRELLLPKVRDLIPVDSGELEDALTVRAAGKRGQRVGHSVGFREPLFRGDTFYGGFVEFGFDHHNAGHIPADSYLRRPLYENEVEVRRFVADELRSFVRTTNRHVRDRL